MCDCIDRLNELLAEKNTVLDIRNLVSLKDGSPGVERVSVSTTKIDTRKRTPLALVVATFCPFCGERYE